MWMEEKLGDPHQPEAHAGDRGERRGLRRRLLPVLHGHDRQREGRDRRRRRSPSTSSSSRAARWGDGARVTPRAVLTGSSRPFAPGGPRAISAPAASARAGRTSRRRRLKAAGYRIRERNYRGRSGEIDFVAEENGVLCFIEVKGRSGVGYGAPAEAVTLEKQRRIARAAQEYVRRQRVGRGRAALRRRRDSRVGRPRRRSRSCAAPSTFPTTAGGAPDLNPHVKIVRDPGAPVTTDADLRYAFACPSCAASFSISAREDSSGPGPIQLPQVRQGDGLSVARRGTGLPASAIGGERPRRCAGDASARARGRART